MLIANAAAVARRSYSMWALYVLAVLELVQLVPQLLEPFGWFGLSGQAIAALSLLAVVAGIVGRLIPQRRPVDRGGFWRGEAGAVQRRVVAGTLAATMALAVPLTAYWEGMRTEAYRDIVGVWTVCAGETKGVKPGDRYTVAQCNAMLGDRVAEFYAGVERCAPQIARAPVEVRAAVTSWAYNVGLGAACGSTLAKRIRAGEFKAACHELPRWNRAGGRVIQGLSNRRGAERALCLSGL